MLSSDFGPTARRRRTGGLVLALLLAVLGGPAAASENSAAALHDYGIYKLNVLGKVNAPGDISGERNVVSGVNLFRKTRTVMAQLGRSFGYRFRVTDPALYGKPLTLRTIFPEMTNPQTKRTVRHQDRPFSAATDRLVYDGYRFDYAWEMAEGTWVFQLRDGDKVLMEQKFKVVVPLN